MNGDIDDNDGDIDDIIYESVFIFILRGHKLLIIVRSHKLLLR